MIAGIIKAEAPPLIGWGFLLCGGALAGRDTIRSFMNIRVADVDACCWLWKIRGAEFIPEPVPACGEIRDCIRDPDGRPAVDSEIDTV